jgi:peptidoglycan-associated lipoprotein
MMYWKAMSVALLLTVAGCATPPPPPPPAPAPTPPPPVEKPEAPEVCASAHCIPERIYFADGSAKIVGDDNRNMLTKIATELKTHPNKSLTIEGHAEERGTREYNLSIGESRAIAVRKALRALGVSNKIKVTSFGNERPTAVGKKNAEKQNRSAALVIQ